MANTPALFAGLVDDAAMFPPGGVPLAEAIDEHRRHRQAWYGDLIGPLLVPVSMVGELVARGAPAEVELCLVADTGINRLAATVDTLNRAGVRIARVEAAVARRGEDPMPGVRELLAVGQRFSSVAVYAEIPLTWGLIEALDQLADTADGPAGRPNAKFRVGGLAAELFPTPAALAGVICACRDRGVRFKLGAGVHRAIRHNDPETGFTHHGVLNVLAASLTAATGAPLAAVADRVAATDPVPLVEIARASRNLPRPLWTGFSGCRIQDLLADLRAYALLGLDSTASDNPGS